MFPGFWQLMIVLVLILLIFGTKRLKDAGGDLGGAIKGFKKAMKDDEGKKVEQTDTINQSEREKQD